MNQRKLKITLLIILGLLVITSLILGLTRDIGTNTIENKALFSLRDTTNVDMITIKSTHEYVALEKTEGVWMLNEKYKAEQNIVKVLLSILKDAEVVRNAPQTQTEEIASHILANGYLIEIFKNDDLIKSFYASGNDTKTATYMMSTDKKDPAIVNIPGYESYVAGIFEIPVNDWRDRVILSTNWRTLQKLQINYTQYPQYDLSIKFDFNFLTVEGVKDLDTARMMSYIDEFNFLQADRYLDKGQSTVYDSLLNTPKTVSLTIEDINPKNSKTIAFYPLLKNDPMMLGYVQDDEQSVLFEANRIQKLFAVKDDFEIKSTEK